jgi:multiple sugar transport system substrate-binding protein
VEANVQQFVNFPDARLQVMDPPAGPAGAFVSGAAGYLVIAEASANKPAALDFIKYVTTGAPYNDYIAQSLLFPVSTNADAQAMYGKVSEKRAYDFLAAALPQTKAMLFPAALPYNGYEYLVGEINNYLSGQKSLDQMISDAKAQTATLAANAGL